MCFDLINITNSLDSIYSRIFTWLLQNDSTYENRVRELQRTFLNEEIEIVECYKNSLSYMNEALHECDKILLEVDGLKDLHLKFILCRGLLKYLYIDAQKDVFLYNTILNKVLFVEKFNMLYEIVSAPMKEKGGMISQLDLLEFIDVSTSFHYVGQTRELSLTLPEEIQEIVKTYICQFSSQKEWERKYHEVMNGDWPRVIGQLRAIIWKYLDSIGRMPDNDEQKYCIWELLPYIEGVG